MPLSKKIVLLGHFGVGKTSLVRQYVDGAFSEDYLVTIGVQVKKKDLEVNKTQISLIIWDVEGNMAISRGRKSYLLGSHGFVYVFDVTRPETFENLVSEILYLKENYPSIPVIIVGNKSDLIDSDHVKEFFQKQEFKDCHFTSAKNGDNVDLVFMEITKEMIE